MEDLVFLEYSEFKSCIDKYGKGKKRFIIPANELGIPSQYKKAGKILKVYLNNTFDIDFKYSYNTHSFSCIRRKTMHYKYQAIIEIPYAEREKHIDFMYDINRSVSDLGNVTLFVNNVPYYLKAYFCVETDVKEIIDEVLVKTRKQNLSLDKTKNIDILFDELRERMYDFCTLDLIDDRTVFEYMVKNRFIFNSKEELASLGYGEPNKKQPFCFISYCHKDKYIVYDIVEGIQKQGINFWIDYAAIQLDDSILERMDEGMKKSDLALIFISQNTIDSLMAKYELKSFFRNIITDKELNKKWILVKIDDVNPNDIFSGLFDYLYFDYVNNDINELISSIKKKLK